MARIIRLTDSGKIIFDDGTNTFELECPTGLAGAVAIELPDADGTAGQFLKTSGAGKLSFGSALTDPGGGSSGQVLSTNGSGVFSWVTRAPYNRSTQNGWYTTAIASMDSAVGRWGDIYADPNYRCIRAGSLTGLVGRIAGAITAGSIVIRVTKNGVNTDLYVTLSSAAQQAIETSVPGTITFAAGDYLGIKFTATVDLAPSNTYIASAGLEITES